MRRHMNKVLQPGITVQLGDNLCKLFYKIQLHIILLYSGLGHPSYTLQQFMSRIGRYRVYKLY